MRNPCGPVSELPVESGCIPVAYDNPHHTSAAATTTAAAMSSVRTRTVTVRGPVATGTADCAIEAIVIRPAAIR